MAVDGDGFQVYKGEKRDLIMDQKKQIGVTSANLCHLANISYRVGRKLGFEFASGRFTDDTESNKMPTRPYRAPYQVAHKVYCGAFALPPSAHFCGEINERPDCAGGAPSGLQVRQDRTLLLRCRTAPELRREE